MRPTTFAKVDWTHAFVKKDEAYSFQKYTKSMYCISSFNIIHICTTYEKCTLPAVETDYIQRPECQALERFWGLKTCHPATVEVRWLFLGDGFFGRKSRSDINAHWFLQKSFWLEPSTKDLFQLLVAFFTVLLELMVKRGSWGLVYGVLGKQHFPALVAHSLVYHSRPHRRRCDGKVWVSVAGGVRGVSIWKYVLATISMTIFLCLLWQIDTSSACIAVWSYPKAK